MKVVLSHPTGNANVRAVTTALARAEMLSRFYTCVALFEQTLFYRICRLRPFREFHRRSFDPVLKPCTRTRPYREIGRLASQKMGWHQGTRHEKGVFCVDKVYQDLDAHVARKVPSAKAVYAYEDGALHSFTNARKTGVTCLYDLPTGHWRAHRQFLKKDLEQYPEWTKTLNFLKDSEIKLARKDRELELADAVFVASSFTKRTLELYPGTLPPVYLQPYGFPEVCQTRVYRNPRNRKLKLLFVGGLSQMKGLANLFEAVEGFRAQVELTIVGKKKAEGCKPLEKGLAKHNWIPSLPQPQVLTLMREHDVFIFPSLFEGYGLVVAEAMSQGTPVITTERTCGADFIEDGKNGWLVPAGNTHALKEKIAAILEKPNSIASIGRAAMKTAAAFPMSLYGERMAQNISTILKD